MVLVKYIPLVAADGILVAADGILYTTEPNHLITNRTQADLDRVRALGAKGMAGMTADELAEWLSGMRGAYNASDLNRVEGAVEQLALALRSLPDELVAYAASQGVAWDAFFRVPYDPTPYDPTVKTDWALEDIPAPEQMARYLGNVELLKTALYADYPALPDGMDNLTLQGANAIELALERLDEAITALCTATKTDLDNTASAWYYSGEIYGNEV